MEFAARNYAEEKEEGDKEMEDATEAMYKLTTDNTALDKGTLKDEAEDKYYRSMRLCSIYKKQIKELKEDIDKLLEHKDEQLTEYGRENKMIEVKTKI